MFGFAPRHGCGMYVYGPITFFCVTQESPSSLKRKIDDHSITDENKLSEMATQTLNCSAAVLKTPM